MVGGQVRDPPSELVRNTRTGRGNIKLEVFSWEIVEEMVKKGLRIEEKTHKGEVWGKPPRKARPGTSLLPPTLKPHTQPNKRQNSLTPHRRSNKCFRYGIEGHYIASNNNTSRTSAWSISTTTPSPTSLKTELYSGKHHEEAYLFFLADTLLPWSLR